MPEFDTHDPRHRYAEISKILMKIAYLMTLKDCHGRNVLTREQVEKRIRTWYAQQSMCQSVTQRDRIQAAWTQFDYAVITDTLAKTPKCARYDNPEELV